MTLAVFNERERAVLASYRQRMLSVRGKLSEDLNDRLPGLEYWEAACEANGEEDWRAFSERHRALGLKISLGKSPCPDFRLAMDEFVTIIELKLAGSNEVARLFEEFDGKLLPPVDEALHYLAEIDALRKQLAEAERTIAQRDATIAELQRMLDAEAGRVRQQVNVGLANIGAIHVDLGDWIGTALSLLKRENLQFLLGSVRRAASAALGLARATRDWAGRAAERAIENGANGKVVQIEGWLRQIEGPQAPASPTYLPADFDEAEVRAMILRGETPPSEWHEFIVELDLTGDDAISTLSPLQALTNLRRLYLSHTEIDDLNPLSGLVRLQLLDLDYTQVADLSPLTGLSNLQCLFLNGTRIVDLNPLRGLKNIRTLFLNSTNVWDVTPLQKIENLDSLDLCHTQVKELTPLKYLAKLTELYLVDTHVADLAPLARLENLQELWLDDTQVTDVSVLDHLVHLTIHGGPKPRFGRPRT